MPAFGQKTKITWLIKGIILNYPQDTQIFKEQLQNTDDAGGRVFKMLIDERVVKLATSDYMAPFGDMLTRTFQAFPVFPTFPLPAFALAAFALPAFVLSSQEG